MLFDVAARKNPLSRRDRRTAEYDVEEQDGVYPPGAEKASKVGTIVAIDFERQTVDLRKGPKWAETHPPALFKHETVAEMARRLPVLLNAVGLALMV